MMKKKKYEDYLEYAHSIGYTLDEFVKVMGQLEQYPHKYANNDIYDYLKWCKEWQNAREGATGKYAEI